MTPEQAVAKLVRAGATLAPAPGEMPVPVGLMERIGPGRWFWWAAGGDTEFDAHVIDCEAARVWHDGMAVDFSSGGQLASDGYLTTVEESIDAPQGQANARLVLRDWRERYERDERLRGFIERQKREASE